MKMQLIHTQNWLSGNERPCGSFSVYNLRKQDTAIRAIGLKDIIIIEK
jgi:hypothetical protein